MVSVRPGVAEVIVRSPADGAEVGRVPARTPDEVAAMAANLRAAQPEWEQLGFAGRSRWLGRWRDWILDHEAPLARIVQRETGKSWNDTCSELPMAAEVINYYARHAEAFLQVRRPRPHTPAMALKRLELHHSPYPLVGLVTPWNVPIGLPMMDLPAALMAGCAVLTKPSELTPLSWEEMVRGWTEDLGAPPILASATGGGDTGAAVIDVVDMVQFTGSVRTGRRIAARCGERLVPCSLELGGKDPMIVLADADLERAANAAVWGGFINAGQACVSVERVYVEAPVYDEFTRLIVGRVAELRVGTETDGRVAFDFGAMASQAQLEVVDRHVRDALSKGARALTGGRPRPGSGLYYEPTVLVDVDHSMACMRDETFGPTLPIMCVENRDEAVRLANDATYGLSASVWTRDREQGRRVALELAAGAVNVNNVFINLFQFPLPQGGWGDSSLGASRFGGPDGIRKYCRTKSIVADRFEPATEPTWYPASPLRLGIVRRAARLLVARDWRRRLGLRPHRQTDH